MPFLLRGFAKQSLRVTCFVLFLSSGTAFAQTSIFTYQGRLSDGGTAANGTYDLEFKLYDALTFGNLQGSPNTITKAGVNVINGIFTVQLDFGAGAFPGADRFLDIGVKHPADSSYTPLLPRQQLTSTPYAIRSTSALTADNATTATTATNNVLKSGDTMTGPLVLSADPTAGLGAATKQYVDNADALKLNLSGGTMSGVLNMGSNKITSLAAPTIGTDAANKSYVDSAVPTAANFVFSYDTTSQTVVQGGTFQDITFNNNPQINGWTHAAGTASFTCNQTGMYLIEYVAKMSTSFSAPTPATVIASLNGTEVPGSQLSFDLTTFDLTFSGSKSFVASVNTGQVLKLQVTSGSAGVQLIANRGFGTTRPSVSLTIIRIQ